MAPVPKSSSDVLLQPKRVDLGDFDHEGSPVKDISSRPCYEKLQSCDFSVEESAESSENEELFAWTNPFSTTTSKEKVFYPELKTLLVKLQEKPAPKSLDLEEGKLWKLGALDQAKTRSPTENDDLSLPSHSSLASSNGAIDESGVSCSNLSVKGMIPREDEHPEGRDHLVPTPAKKRGTKKIKVKSTDKCLANPGKPKSQQNAVFKRQSIGKKKRNTYEILCPDVPHQLPKKIKVRRKALKKRSGTSSRQQRPVSSYKSSGMPTGYKCVDSGVSTGCSYNSGNSSDGGSCSDGGSGGGSCGGGGGGGGGGFYKKGGLGGHGGDDNEDKKPISLSDVNMKDDDEEEDEDNDTKMSSKDGSGMDCNEGDNVTHSSPWEDFKFTTQNLQHSAYCRKDDCNRPLCSQMKGEVEHIESHKCDHNCLRCNKTVNLIKYHASQCKVPGCRVYQCNRFRENKEIFKEPVQVVQQPPPPQPVPVYNHSHPFSTNRDVDGRLVYNSTGKPVEMSFQEHINYIKGKKIGSGGNACVYKAHFPPTSPLYDKPMVLKETNYVLSKEEVKVYETIGDHPNIVKHNIITMRGNEGHACIFMDQCDKSLKDLCEHHLMNDMEALFYWCQVVDAVKYLHEKGIIHKDIKAQNVLLSGLAGYGEYFRAKLADFDAAKILDDEFTAAGLKPMGTAGFASPEVMQSEPHGRPADIFGLGCFLMELKGITPKKDQLCQQVQELHTKSQGIANLVSCCVQEDPRARPTASQIQEFLRTVPEEL